LIRSLETDTVKLQSNFRDIEHATVEIADQLENSSCKNTIKMTDRREFSFFDSMKQPKQIDYASIRQSTWGSVNDTVARLQALSNSQKSIKDGIKEGNNPFVG